MKAIDIIQQYPEIFCTPPYDPIESLLAFGFECHSGWYPLILECADKLSRTDNPPRITQVKEKWGTLNINTTATTDKQSAIINDIERRSSHICEICGEPGQLYTDGWYKTRCLTHKDY